MHNDSPENAEKTLLQKLKEKVLEALKTLQRQ